MADSGLRAARRAVLGGARRQRCQFHVARNAIHHAPNAETRKRIGRYVKSIWTADDLTTAETVLAEPVASYRDTASKLAGWLEQNVPDEIDEKWASETKAYIKWECQDA